MSIPTDKTKTPTPALQQELLRLDNQLCFALYAATRAITKTYREKLGAMGLTYPQFLVLMVLWETDGITISEIGRRLMLDIGTLSPLLKRIESMKLIIRAKGKEDEREVHIWLSQKGKDHQDAALDARRYVACRLDISEPEITALRAELMDMVSQLSHKCAGTPAEAVEE